MHPREALHHGCHCVSLSITRSKRKNAKDTAHNQIARVAILNYDKESKISLLEMRYFTEHMSSNHDEAFPIYRSQFVVFLHFLDGRVGNPFITSAATDDAVLLERGPSTFLAWSLVRRIFCRFQSFPLLGYQFPVMAFKSISP